MKDKFIYFSFIISLIFFSACQWENVDYAKRDYDKSIDEKVKSIKFVDLPKGYIGQKELQAEIVIEGLYSDANDYKLSHLNSLMKAYIETDGIRKEIDAEIINKDGLKINLGFPTITKNYKIIIVIDDHIKAEADIEIEKVKMDLSFPNGTLDIWAKSAELLFSSDINTTSLKVLQNDIFTYLRNEKTGEIKNYPFTLSIGNKYINLENLEPSTEYTFVAKFKSSMDSVYLNFTTDKIESLPNSGMEEWGETRTPNMHWALNYPWRYDTKPSVHWDTYNAITTRYGTGAEKVKQKYKSTSGTIPITDKYSGEKAALIRTVAYGAGNSTGILGFGKKAEKVEVGALYLGSFNEAYLKDAKEKANYGIPFSTRPKSLVFFAKYFPKEQNSRYRAEIYLYDDTGIVIAEAKIKDEEAGLSSDYKKIVLDLKYKRKDLKVAKIDIRFFSDKNTSDPYSYIGGSSKDSEWTGSHLYIDDISLEY